jgi:hypothetical protein
VRGLSEKYREVQATVVGNRFLIGKLQYLYLKKKYPSETAGLIQSEFNNETVSLRQKNSEVFVTSG